jgi:acetylglutamate synthase
MLNPLTTILLDQMVQEETLVGLASSEEVTISALVKLDATVFLDVDCCSHKKQDSYDPRINLADKTVVGAINQLVSITNLLDQTITNLSAELKAEIDKKLNKRTTDGRSAVYAVEGEDQLLIRVEVVEEPNTIVKRNELGQIFTANPTQYKHAANKGYVDNVAVQVLDDAKSYTDQMIIEHTGIQYEILEENKNG